ncbi:MULTISPECIES: hypothetical protein [unclassified Clostridium]|uniref:hypothetical protein n=1 Tax=unclassified Clostridium TaxID=2614128 RepID=UPI0002FF1A0E|nr:MULTISPECIES: hypothetical protein [unclassified Clostridium]
MNSKMPGITLLELILKLLIITTLSRSAIFMFTKDSKEFNGSEVRAALQSDGQNIQLFILLTTK